MDKRDLIQFLPKFGSAAKWRMRSGRESDGKRQGRRQLDLFPFFLFLAYQLYSCAATRLSQEVISINCKFLDKIFLQFHPVSEISEMRNERIWFPSLSFYSIRIDSIRPVLWQDFPDFFITSFRGIAWRLFQFSPRLPKSGKKLNFNCNWKWILQLLS